MSPSYKERHAAAIKEDFKAVWRSQWTYNSQDVLHSASDVRIAEKYINLGTENGVIAPRASAEVPFYINTRKGVNVTVNINGRNPQSIVGTNMGKMVYVAPSEVNGLEAVTEALRNLTECVRSSRESDLTKQAITNMLQRLDHQAQQGTEQPQESFSSALIGRLKTSMEVCSSLYEAWNKFGPTIETFFGIK